MDELISSATKGKKDLDDFLPLILGNNFGAEGQLPPEFIDSLSIIVNRVRSKHLLKKYL